MIRLNRVSKAFRQGTLRVAVLSDLSCTIREGDLVTIQGVSGSGKSTLLHLIGALERPDSGSILIGDQDISTYDNRQAAVFRRDSVGIIFQFYNLIPTLTAWENVAMALDIMNGGIPKDYTRVDTVLEQVGLASHAHAFPQELSGGQQQRVAIARGLVKHPAVLLADEPTGNLDEAMSDQVMDLMVRINEEQGTTVLVVTHDPSVAERGRTRLKLHHGVLTPVP
ncbi:MAG TPA: ABC transporter ATP-binding protein [Thermoanaerobaculia bacterium]|nr:ABC transporter ATP-binding protein [Thermoanaerobaculia bacterium]HUM29069.1 ABC transporter ATP-binding protein [Thermoanaerobaculia bacterium]HXK67375.1 ABC transporter ATP-binding protein [Thermoanaerobaculia bacterium]